MATLRQFAGRLRREWFRRNRCYKASATDPNNAGLSDLFCWHSFDNVATDSHTTGIDLTLDNTPTYNASTKKVGSHAIEFTAASQQAAYHEDADTYDVFDNATAMTWAGWFRVKTNSTNNWIASRWASVGGTHWAVRTNNAHNGLFVFISANSGSDVGSNYVDTGDISITTDTWYHLAFTYDGTESTSANRVKVYLDADEKSVSETGTIPATLSDSGARLSYGRFGNYNSWCNGFVDTPGLWSGTKTAGQISWLYNDGDGRAFSELA